jgi:dipeptidyl aminopeptidase/acylaminoacyl peptidase/mono/diheme cytochrome c family protein
MSRLVGIALLCWATVSYADPVSFKKDIAPILQNNCFACHGPKKAEGGYRVDNFEKLTGAGDSGTKGFEAKKLDSESFRRITSADKDERMPKDGDPLPPEQIALIKQWLEEGAVYDGGDPKAALSSIMPPPLHPPAPPEYRAAPPITAVLFSLDGKELFAGGYHEITVWNPENGQLVRRIANVGQRTYGLALKPDGSQLAVAGGAPGRLGEVRVYNPATGELLKVIAPTADVAYDVQWSPAGDRLATCAADGVVRIFDAATFAEQLVITSHSDWVFAVAWSPDGTKLATASRDKTAKVFDAKTGELTITYSAHAAPVRGVLFHPDGAEVYTSGSNNKWERWKIADGAKTKEIGVAGPYKLVRVGESIFVPTEEPRIRMYKAKEGDQVREFLGATDWCLSVAAHDATGRVAAGTFDGEVRLWQLADGKPLLNFYAAPGFVKK